MKNYLSLFILTILTINLVAQDITVTFKTSDAGAVIDSFQAINLATNDTVRLKGNETLTLINLTSGIYSMQNMKGSIFPNPCNGSATLQFSTSADDDATIQIVNASGQLVMEKKLPIFAGAHSFSVKFSGPGIYIVLVKSSNEVLRFKEVSNMVGMQEASLSYLGSIQQSLETATLKSAPTGKTLNYSTGNNIMYTLYSGKNSRVIAELPTTSKTFDVAFYACADKDGGNYKTVIIGEQVWMAENLAYLPYTTDSKTYSRTDPCYYVSNFATYGVLYNWSAALTACPLGWHLPTWNEWVVLANNLGGAGVAGGKMKSTMGWESPNEGATNESCFSALPGGRWNFGFSGVGNGSWWSSWEDNKSVATCVVLCWRNSMLDIDWDDKYIGMSVRCLKD